MKTVIVQAQQKWEHLVVDRRSEVTLVEDLNALGQKCWELVSAMTYKDAKGIIAWTAFLKRPSTGQPPTTPESQAIGSAIGSSAGTAIGSAIVSGAGSSVDSKKVTPREVKVGNLLDLDTNGITWESRAE